MNLIVSIDLGGLIVSIDLGGIYQLGLRIEWL